MAKRRYNWVIRTLENWADHWIRAARVHEIQTSSQLYDKILEGKAPKSTKQYMKLPSRKGLIQAHVPNFPIMDDWQRHVQNVVRELSVPHQKVIFERYFGQEFDRFGYEDWAKHLGLSKSAYGGRLKKAHRIVKAKLDGTLQGAFQSVRIG